MNLSDKMSYLCGMVDGMNLDLTTKEGKVLGQILDIMKETILYVDDLQGQVDELTELCDSLDEDLGDVERVVFETVEDEDEEETIYTFDDDAEDDDADDDEDEIVDVAQETEALFRNAAYDDDADEDEDLYEVVCPSCNNTIVLAGSVLEEGTMRCPCCNELLEFDYSGLAEDAEDADATEEAEAEEE